MLQECITFFERSIILLPNKSFLLMVAANLTNHCQNCGTSGYRNERLWPAIISMSLKKLVKESYLNIYLKQKISHYTNFI